MTKQDQIEILQNQVEAYSLFVADLQSYLLSSKFHEDKMVNSRDVLARIQETRMQLAVIGDAS